MKKSKTRIVKIKSDEENPEPLDLIAKSIIDIANAFEKIQKSKVKERVIELLIYDALSHSVNIKDIKQVLNIVPQLKNIYLKK